jgi:hypothetical protein
MSKQSVFKKQLYERIVKSVFRSLFYKFLRNSPTSEVSIGDRHGKGEDAKCMII